LLTSGYTDIKAHKEAVEDCGFMLLRKPYELQDLLECVWQLLNDGDPRKSLNGKH